MPCRVAAGTNPVFETLLYASLVPVMQSCQQERDPGRVQGGFSCRGPPQEARKVSWERRGWWVPRAGTHPDFLRALGLAFSWGWECCSLAGGGRGPSGQRPDLNPCLGTQQLGAPQPCAPICNVSTHLADSLWGTEVAEVGRAALLKGRGGSFHVCYLTAPFYR